MEDKRLFYNQPGVVIKMKAKEGRGQELFDLCLKAKHLEELGIDDPTDWVLCRSDEDNDVLLAFEFSEVMKLKTITTQNLVLKTKQMRLWNY